MITGLVGLGLLSSCVTVEDPPSVATARYECVVGFSTAMEAVAKRQDHFTIQGDKVLLKKDYRDDLIILQDRDRPIVVSSGLACRAAQGRCKRDSLKAIDTSPYQPVSRGYVISNRPENLKRVRSAFKKAKDCLDGKRDLITAEFYNDQFNRLITDVKQSVAFARKQKAVRTRAASIRKKAKQDAGLEKVPTRTRSSANKK